jgi:F-type H+-transporting ATPase subunit gamma
MVEVLESIAAHTPGAESPLLLKHPQIKRIAVIVIASDKGLAGGFNSSVLRAAERFISAQLAAGVQCELVACGKTAGAYLSYRGFPLALEFRDQSADPQIAQAREIASLLIEEYSTEKIDEVVVFYNHTKNVADQIQTSEVILPIEKVSYQAAMAGEDQGILRDESAKTAAVAASTLSEARKSAADTRVDEALTGDFDFEPSAEAVLEALLPAYVETRIYHALLDSAAGEQGARRKAMKSATDNATDMISTLTRVYNRARQSAITTEITEIVGGAAALEEE